MVYEDMRSCPPYAVYESNEAKNNDLQVDWISVAGREDGLEGQTQKCLK